MKEIQKIEIDENGKQILMIYWPVGTAIEDTIRAAEQIMDFLASSHNTIVLSAFSNMRVELIKIGDNDEEK